MLRSFPLSESVRSSHLYHLVKMESLPIPHNIYKKQNDIIAEQREGLNMLLMISQQTKAGHQQIVMTRDVMNIADFLLLFSIQMKCHHFIVWHKPWLSISVKLMIFLLEMLYKLLLLCH